MMTLIAIINLYSLVYFSFFKPPLFFYMPCISCIRLSFNLRLFPQVEPSRDLLWEQRWGKRSCRAYFREVRRSRKLYLVTFI